MVQAKLLRNALAATVVSTISTVPNLAQAEGQQGSIIAWQPCGEDFPGVECASVRVPLDYDRPWGRKISLALARVPASNSQQKIGTIFVNPGGPGGSGVQLVQFGFGQELEQQLGGRFDVVGFDPRGVAESTPIRCFDTNDEQDQLLANLPIFPFESAQERPYFDTFQEYTRRCLRRRQPILRNMGTANVARDLDYLRDAVGDRKLTYLGFSYGSYIGSVYANLFPKNVRALVIDGILNPTLWTGGLQIVSDRFATLEVFEEFLRLCDAAGAPSCALSGPNGAKARYEVLEAALLQQPFVFPDGSTYSYDFLIADTTGFMYAPEFWTVLTDFLGALADAVGGDAVATERAATARQAIAQLWRTARPQREDIPYNNGFDAFLGNLCADGDYPSNFQSFTRFGAFSQRGSRFGPYWWWSNAPCASWPLGRDRYNGPWVGRTSFPVLVVGNFFDPATDYASALATSKLLTNSRLLSYAGWGHTAFGRNQCTTDLIVDYLVSRRLPAKDTVCPANANPFASATGLQAESLRAPASMPKVGLPPPRPGR